MIESILGGLLGGVLRLVPEVLKWLDRRGERQHELALYDREIKLAEMRLEGELRRIEATGDVLFAKASMDALRSSVVAQGKATGFAGQLSSLVRPVITFLFFGIWCSVKLASFFTALDGATWQSALSVVWTEADQALWAAILNFWFMGRVFDKVLEK
ncbi:MAG: hypothetical protein QXT45_04200 [Candidatus Bilamarchaeaceae archaeon]